MKVELSLRGKWKVKLRGSGDFLMETSIWQGHSSSSFLSISSLSLTPSLPVWMFTCLTCLLLTFSAYTNFIHFHWLTDWAQWKWMCVFGFLHHINTQRRLSVLLPVFLWFCLTICDDRPILNAKQPCVPKRNITQLLPAILANITRSLCLNFSCISRHDNTNLFVGEWEKPCLL